MIVIKVLNKIKLHIYISGILIIKTFFFHLGKPNPPLVKVVQRWKQKKVFQESNTITDKEESERQFKSAVCTPS